TARDTEAATARDAEAATSNSSGREQWRRGTQRGWSGLLLHRQDGVGGGRQQAGQHTRRGGVDGGR
uniref:Uncharacterized protein n=1 Tax=Oryza glaberrima TaxID=4538 RepID=I1QZZ2_ORYGL